MELELLAIGLQILLSSGQHSQEKTSTWKVLRSSVKVSPFVRFLLGSLLLCD